MGMLDLGKLVIGITVDDKEAKKSIDDLKKRFKDFTKDCSTNNGKAMKTIITGIANMAKKGAENFGKLKKKVIIALTAIFTSISSTITACVKRFMDLSDAIDKNSQKLGISAEAYQKWGYVFERNGANIDNFARSMKTMIKNANEGSDAFKKLGVSVKDSSGKMRSQEEIMNDTIMALASMDDVNKRNALAMEIFGNQYTEILPLLNQGKEALQEQYQFLEKYGLVISDDAVQAGVKLGDTINDIKRIMSAFGAMLGSKFVPKIQQVADFILAHAGEIIAFISDTVDGIMKFVDDSIAFVRELFEPVVEDLMKFYEDNKEEIDAFVETIERDVKPIFDVVANGIRDIVNIGKSIFLPIAEKVIKTIIENKTAIDALFGIVKIGIQVIIGALEVFIGVMGVVYKVVSDVVTGIYNWFWQTLVPAVSQAFNDIVGYLTQLYDDLVANVNEAWNSVAGFVEDVKGIATDLYNAGKDAIDNFLQGLKDAWLAVSQWITAKVDWIKNMWNSAGNEMTRLPAEGKHRTGLREVPYDGYLAELHKGEMILTAPEANAYQNRASGTQTVSNITVNNYSPKALTEAETARQFRKTQRKLELGFGG